MTNFQDDAPGADVELGERPVAVSAGQLHVVEAGPIDGAPLLFVNGWPQTARAWRGMMALAAGGA